MSTVDFKFIKNYCQTVFYRPYLRKQHYFYFGLEHDSDTFVTSNTEDSKFKYCAPLQTTGLIKVINKDHLSKINDWFSYLCIDRNIPSIFYFDRICKSIGDIPWDSQDIKIITGPHNWVYISIGNCDNNILIARPLEIHFILMGIQYYVSKYKSVFFSDTHSTLNYQTPDHKNKLSQIPISCDELMSAGLVTSHCNDINLILIPGSDVLQDKSLIKKNHSYNSGIKLWTDSSPSCLNYGGFYTDANVSLVVVRDNVFLFPRTKR